MSDPASSGDPAALTPEARGEVAGRGRLEGRNILIVGAGQQDYGLEDPPLGNGRAMSRLFTREGARVAIADIDESALAETARQVAQEGAQPVSITADAGDPDDIERMVKEAHDGLGALDGLVANVGIFGGWGLENTTPEDWDHVFNVNVRGHYYSARHALEVMPDGASIVLVSSIAGRMPGNQLVTYHTTKAALEGLCLWLAKEAARRRIRVNLLVPGLIDTSLGRLASASDAKRAAAATRTPLRRSGTAWEIAYAATFLLSGESSYMTGQSLVIDGGLLSLR